MSPEFAVGFRWYIVVAGLVAGLAMLGSFVIDRHYGDTPPAVRTWLDRYAEAMALLGGGGICLAISIGTVGFLYGWDPIFRLPLTAATLTFSSVGRSIQLVRRWRHVQRHIRVSIASTSEE